VTEPTELFRLECANDHRTTAISLTHFKRNNPLVCRVSARYNHGSTRSSQNSSSTFNLQTFIHYYKLGSNISKLIQTVFKLTNITACPKFTAEGKVYATTHIAKADTKLSPGPGVTPEGHCRPGTGPTPRTSQKERTLATQGCPWDSQRLYLKQILARLSILILSKAYPSLGIL
jgi:hypothetical protein